MRKLSSLFGRFKKTKHSISSSYLDLKLLRKIKPATFPTWRQLKYLGKFLNPTEKRITWAACITLFLAIVGWSIYAITTHSVLVPKIGGEYSEALIGQPKYINPLFASTNDIDSDISSLVYSGLFKYDNSKNIVPDLAQDVTIGSDQKTYDIKLKSGLKWSDGEPITTDDILFTFETLQNAEAGSPLIASFQGVRLEKTGDDTVRFTLKTPYAPFLDTLTMGILPEHIWADILPANIRLAKFNWQPIGSGAWKFDKMVKDNSGSVQSYTLIPNENYYGKKPFLQSITFKFFNNHNEAVSALRSQNVLGISFVPHNLKDKVTGKNLNNFSIQLPQYTALFFNKSAFSELKDADLRLALNEALDKKTIINEALDGDGLEINSPILPGNLGYNDSIKKIEFDTEAANKLLDKKWPRIEPEEYFKIRHDQIVQSLKPAQPASKDSKTDDTAALPEIDENKINDTIRSEMNSEQSFYRKLGKTDILHITITTADTPEYIKTAQEVAKMWQAIGIQTSVNTVASRQIVRDALKDRNYQVLIYGEMIGADPDLYSFWHSSQSEYPGLNLAKFSDRDADKILEDARVTLDTDARSKLYQKFQDILAKELPAVFLYSPTYIMSVSKDIKGIDVSNLVSPQDRFNNINDWYIKTKRQVK